MPVFPAIRHLADSSEPVYDEMFDINVKGVFFTIQKALPLLNDGGSRKPRLGS